jgi:hypothetical protein
MESKSLKSSLISLIHSFFSFLQQILFDAPYNRELVVPRLTHWADWRIVIFPMLGRLSPTNLNESSYPEISGSKLALETLLSGGTGLPLMGTENPDLNVEEVQKRCDMMHITDKPLDLEDAATIISGSISLVDSCPEEEKLATLLETGKSLSMDIPQLDSLAEKKKELQEKLDSRNVCYQRAKDDNERKLAMETDVTEAEGLQVFRPSYQMWRDLNSSK